MKITKTYLKQLIKEELEKIKRHPLTVRNELIKRGFHEMEKKDSERAAMEMGSALEKAFRGGREQTFSLEAGPKLEDGVSGFYNTNNGNIAVHVFQSPADIYKNLDAHLAKSGPLTTPFKTWDLVSYADYRQQAGYGHGEFKDLIQFLEDRGIIENGRLGAPMSPENLKKYYPKSSSR